MTTQSLPKPSAEDLARSARVRQRLADFAHDCNVNAGFATKKKRQRYFDPAGQDGGEQR